MLGNPQKILGDVAECDRQPLRRPLFPCGGESATGCLLRDYRKKSKEKAEYVLQSTTYVAFCNGAGRGESVDEVARRSNREIGDSIAILKGQSTITHDLVDLLLQPMNCLRSVQRDRTLARNGINAPVSARFA